MINIFKKILGISNEGVLRLVVVFLLPFYFLVDLKLYDSISNSELPIVTPENIEDYLNNVFGYKITHEPHSELYMKSEYEKYINPILDSLEKNLEQENKNALERLKKNDYEHYEDHLRSSIRWLDSLLVNNLPTLDKEPGYYDARKNNFKKDVPTFDEFKELKSKFVAYEPWSKKSFYNESPDIYKWSGKPKIFKYNWEHSRLVTSVFYTLFLYFLIIRSFTWVLTGFNIKF